MGGSSGALALMCPWSMLDSPTQIATWESVTCILPSRGRIAANGIGSMIGAVITSTLRNGFLGKTLRSRATAGASRWWRCSWIPC